MYGQGCGDSENLHTADRKVKWFGHCEQQYGDSLKDEKQNYHMISSCTTVYCIYPFPQI